MEAKRVPAVERLGAKRDASPPRGKRLKKWAEQSENGWFMSSSSGGSGRAEADEEKEEEEVRQRRINGGCDDKVKELSESEDEDDEGDGEKRRREKCRSERKMEAKRVPAVERLGAKRDASPP